MTRDSAELLRLWCYAVAYDLAQQPAWCEWSLKQIQRAEAPESWICCLAAATSRQEALEGLIAARRSSPEERGAVDELTLSLGVLFARYARGELALGELLRQGGVQADCANATPPCEEYYELLTALERDEGAREQIAAAAERLFAAPHQRAARELARIGITI